MKQVPIEELVEAVRVTLDENQVESEYLATGTDNMELDEIIRAKLVYAVRSILEMCPVGMMEAEEMDLPDTAQLPTDDGSGSIVLPEDFLRLVNFKLKSWNRAVTTVASIMMESSFRVTLKTLLVPMENSMVVYPRQETSRVPVSIPSGRTNEKLPSRSVLAPVVVPFIRTPAPMTGVPYESMTVPEMTLSSTEFPPPVIGIL